MERRRRAGFLPQKTESQPKSEPIVSHPPGYILNFGSNENKPSNVESLQSKCLATLSKYILEYEEAMGAEQIHAALSLLPSETIADLSVAISKTIGITNGLAIALGKHAHVDALSFRATQDDDGLDDDGLRQLVPHVPSAAVHDSWEDFGDSDEALVDVMQLEGCNVRIKRLELLDCQLISADVLLDLLEKCACITHLSLSGSLNGTGEGERVFRSLPTLLPALEVVDVTRCAWVTTSVLDRFLSCYESSQEAPLVLCQDCFVGSYEGSRRDW